MADQHADLVPTALDWVMAVGSVYDTYPADVFPPDSDSRDARAGTWARMVCENIIREAHRRAEERTDG